MAASKIISQLIWMPVKIRKNKTEKIALLRFYRGVENKAAFTIATPTKFENAALFLRLGLPSTLIRHQNAAFSLRLGLPSTLIRHQSAAFSLRLGLPSTLIRHKNGAFRKRSLNRRNQLKTPAFRFLIGENQFEKKSFSKTKASKTSDAF